MFLSRLLVVLTCIVATSFTFASKPSSTTPTIVSASPLQSGTFEYDECFGAEALCAIKHSKSYCACVKDTCLGIDDATSRAKCAVATASITISSSSILKATTIDSALFPDRVGSAAIASKISKSSSASAPTATTKELQANSGNGGKDDMRPVICLVISWALMLL